MNTNTTVLSHENLSYPFLAECYPWLCRYDACDRCVVTLGRRLDHVDIVLANHHYGPCRRVALRCHPFRDILILRRDIAVNDCVSRDMQLGGRRRGPDAKAS